MDEPEIIAIGTIDWNNQLQADMPDRKILRTLAPLAGRRLTVDQLMIEPGLCDRLAPGELNQVRVWVSESVQLKFGPDDFERARQLLAEHDLLVKS